MKKEKKKEVLSVAVEIRGSGPFITQKGLHVDVKHEEKRKEKKSYLGSTHPFVAGARVGRSLAIW